MNNWLPQVITAVITAGLTGGVGALFLIPRQRRLLEAKTADVIAGAYDRLVDQLQDDVRTLRAQLGEERKASARERRACLERTQILEQDNTKLKQENAALRLRLAQ